MDGHSEQVCALSIWGERQRGLEPWLPRTRKGGSQEEGVTARRPSKSGPSPLHPDPFLSHFILLVCIHLVRKYFRVVWIGNARPGGRGLQRPTKQVRETAGRTVGTEGRAALHQYSPCPQEGKAVHTETPWGKQELGGVGRSLEEAPALGAPLLPSSGGQGPRPQETFLVSSGSAPKTFPLLPPPSFPQSHTPLVPRTPLLWPFRSSPPPASSDTAPASTLQPQPAGPVPTSLPAPWPQRPPPWRCSRAPAVSLLTLLVAGRTQPPTDPPAALLLLL